MIDLIQALERTERIFKLSSIVMVALILVALELLTGCVTEIREIDMNHMHDIRIEYCENYRDDFIRSRCETKDKICFTVNYLEKGKDVFKDKAKALEACIEKTMQEYDDHFEFSHERLTCDGHMNRPIKSVADMLAGTRDLSCSNAQITCSADIRRTEPIFECHRNNK